MVIRHMYIHMKINMLHIYFFNFPFAQRVSEFLISPWHRAQALPGGGLYLILLYVILASLFV